MSLTRYKRKRNFRHTPEPEGKEQRGGDRLRFVVQKHAAGHLHYDFRLELDGVLKSWAVPKGPSMNPGVRRLAMAVEDHPIDYRTFEGTIPKGNYGAGEVIVWDEGTYHADRSTGPVDNVMKLRDGFKNGALKFVLEGKKLKGRFTLVRTSQGSRDSWLLMKGRDQYATDKDILEEDASVISGRRLETEEKESKQAGQSAAPYQPPAAVEKATEEQEAQVPNVVHPMLARLTKEAFDDPQWLFEVKWDGYRAIAEINHGDVKLYSRKGTSFTERYAPVTEGLKKLDHEAVLDGEVVVVDEEGRSHFQFLQNYQRTGKGDLYYYVFDLLRLDGEDLRNRPLVERKERLNKLLKGSSVVRYSDHVIGDGKSFMRAARKQHLEGIIAKDMRSPYREGERSGEWLKIKTAMRQEAIICGYTEPRGARKYLGALVLGVYDNGELVYVGHAGGGFNTSSLKEMKERLVPLRQASPPLARPPKTNMPVTWVKPEVVCEVSFSEWTREGILRQPIFVGVRDDKDAREVVREGFTPEERQMEARITGWKTTKQTARTSRGKQSLELTHLDKVYWPHEGFTKGDLIEYYQSVARYMLPYLKDRPQTLNRHPNGIKGTHFFQKDLPESAPDWLRTAELPAESTGENVRYLVCTDESSLLYMVNLGCIEINPWFSRVDTIDNPDYLVIDLDPEGVGFERVVETALAVKDVLDKAGVKGYPKTSGATGMHIYVPLHAKYEYEVARDFTLLLCKMANNALPNLTSLERSPGKRQKKVYLDYLQNKIGSTVAAPYSVRPRPGAPVATPLDWKEVKPSLDPGDFTIKTVPKRLQRKKDLLKGVLGRGIDIEKCIKRLEKEA